MARDIGRVEALCNEIGFPFDKRLERPDLFVLFVKVIVEQVADIMAIQDTIAGKIKNGIYPSSGAWRVLDAVNDMLNLERTGVMIERSEEIHSIARELNPDDAYPCDHNIDMLSSCTSAIRFGLADPCRSRHAAEAANHVWKHVYRVGLFDNFTSKWQKEWAYAQFQEAVLRCNFSEGVV